LIPTVEGTSVRSPLENALEDAVRIVVFIASVNGTKYRLTWFGYR
jgi:hypothetical protein